MTALDSVERDLLKAAPITRKPSCFEERLVLDHLCAAGLLIRAVHAEPGSLIAAWRITPAGRRALETGEYEC